jgi:hypothetical protein
MINVEETFLELTRAIRKRTKSKADAAETDADGKKRKKRGSTAHARHGCRRGRASEVRTEAVGELLALLGGHRPLSLRIEIHFVADDRHRWRLGFVHVDRPQHEVVQHLDVVESVLLVCTRQSSREDVLARQDGLSTPPQANRTR